MHTKHRKATINTRFNKVILAITEWSKCKRLEPLNSIPSNNVYMSKVVHVEYLVQHIENTTRYICNTLCNTNVLSASHNGCINAFGKSNYRLIIPASLDRLAYIVCLPNVISLRTLLLLRQAICII